MYQAVCGAPSSSGIERGTIAQITIVFILAAVRTPNLSHKIATFIRVAMRTSNLT